MMKFLYFLMVLNAVGAQFPESFKAFFTPVKKDKPVVQAPDFLSGFMSESEEDQSHHETGDVSHNMKAESKHQPQCQVEVRVVQRRPGQCILLDDNTPACQTSEFLYPFHSECMAML
ncbi:hypothetical protein CDAR_381221 [Caerostris darwini]|uniref:Secreted protein n=1 Tax=Caerostris darwini TaxID=1538125 RepID=A0AAV4PMJ5_9ARAC|nr:hypothetical protein CDAR_381221 [Caerostris darwini]